MKESLQIILAKHAGFCFGVKRALQFAQEATEQYGPILSLGPLIHNPQEVERLSKQGINSVENLEQVDGDHLIIRSHGIGPRIISAATERKINIIDATCPFVKRAQAYAKELADVGYTVVVVGDKKHPEVEGIVGWSNDTAFVVENPEHAREISEQDKIGVIAQTTQTEDNFQKVVEVLRSKTPNLKVHNTICHATAERQEATANLAKEVDVMIVVGGLNSANTKKLARICRDAGTTTYHVEKASEIDVSWFRGVEKAGITAGASTPDWIIEEVLQRMSEINQLEEQKEELKTTTAKEVTEASTGENFENEPSTDTTSVEESQDLYDRDIKEVRRGERITGTVVQVRDDEVLVDVGGKSEGVIPRSEFSAFETEKLSEVIKVGDEIEVLVLKRENEDGHPVLSKKRVDQEIVWEKLIQDAENSVVIIGKVVEVVKGGLLVNVGIRGFLPASQVERGYVEDLKEYVGKELRMKVIEIDRYKNKLVLSAKAVLDEEYQKQKEETFSSLEEGQTRKGVVRRITNFGAFVDIGGVDGLLHVSEMAWYRVNHPSDVLKVGDEMEVFILGVDLQKEKVSLGLKQLIPDPWSNAVNKYPEGAIINAKVVRTAPFGAFVQVEPGIEGLVHISQLADYRVVKTEDVVNPGDEVKVKVLKVDAEAKRMSLSIKEADETADVEEMTPPNNDLEEPEGVTIGDIVGDMIKND